MFDLHFLKCESKFMAERYSKPPESLPFSIKESSISFLYLKMRNC